MKSAFNLASSYSLREGIAAMDFAGVQTWLAASYWAQGINQEQIEREARNSALVLGVFAADGLQVGYTRVISDKSRFAYLCDVIVNEAHRGRGLGRAMVKYALDHPEFAAVRTWALLTRDAHKVYAPLGFRPVTDPVSRPNDWMVLRHSPLPWTESETTHTTEITKKVK
jgi:GNAT superfamily N-acetyltransferase